MTIILMVIICKPNLYDTVSLVLRFLTGMYTEFMQTPVEYMP